MQTTISPPNERTCVLKDYFKILSKEFLVYRCCSSSKRFSHIHRNYMKNGKVNWKNWVTALELENSQQFSIVIAFGGFGCKKRFAPSRLLKILYSLSECCWIYQSISFCVGLYGDSNRRMWLFNRGCTVWYNKAFFDFTWSIKQ